MSKYRLSVIGDAGQPGLVFDAVHQGYRAGSEVA